MINIKTHKENSIIAVKASKTLSKKDFDKLAPALKDFAERSQDSHLLMILERFKGWEDVSAFWEDLKLDAEFIGEFDRIAIVGESKWQNRELINSIYLPQKRLSFFKSIMKSY
tara:strand:+ start:429 stop:767 length:339 start_codon:yes stop_codon:yes gene_type:complete